MRERGGVCGQALFFAFISQIFQRVATRHQPVDLGDDAVLRIYSDDDGPLSVSCDGDEPFTVSAQGSITVEKADICASFIRLKNDSFVDILNRKMMKWNSSSHDEREV